MTGYILINMRTGKPITITSSSKSAKKRRETLYKKGSKKLRIGILSGRGEWVGLPTTKKKKRSKKTLKKF